MQEGRNLIIKGHMYYLIQIVTLNLKKQIMNKSLSQALFPDPPDSVVFLEIY